jgi:hypothetical protein
MPMYKSSNTDKIYPPPYFSFDLQRRRAAGTQDPPNRMRIQEVRLNQRVKILKTGVNRYPEAVDFKVNARRKSMHRRALRDGDHRKKLQAQAIDRVGFAFSKLIDERLCKCCDFLLNFAESS